MSSTVDELARKLREHQDQLAQVDNLLKVNPSDETLLKLQADLRQVVALTEDLTKMQGVPALPGEEDKGWKVGDRCVALWEEDGKWYTARIDSIDNGNYAVTYLDYGNTATVTESNLRQYVPAPPEQLIPGQSVRALWKDLYYAATVSGPGAAPGLFKLKFAKWKKKKDVPAYDIVLREGGADAGPAQTLAEGQLPDKLVIPDNLRIKDGDSEKQKKIKMKKMKRLKWQFHLKKKEEEGNERKNNWQNFQKKMGKAAERKSIFAAPDSVDGRVGVTGSGKNMTTFKDRAKFFSLKIAPDKAGDEEE